MLSACVSLWTAHVLFLGRKLSLHNKHVHTPYPYSVLCPLLSQARLQRANTLLRLGKLNEATKDYEVLAEAATGSIKEDALVQVSSITYKHVDIKDCL